MKMDIEKYLQRIHYKGSRTPDLQSLRDLQSAHLLRVPFENLDIHRKIPIDLDNLYDKIVTRRRGGFCYELNELFFQLLRQIGFDAIRVSARVFGEKKEFGPEFDHLAIVVALKDKKYLVDVGFGEFALYPLPIELNKSLDDPRGVFRFSSSGSDLVVEKMDANGEFIPQYRFSEVARELAEFAEMVIYHQQSPQSHFTQNRICSLPTMTGRISLSGKTLRVSSGTEINIRELKNEEEYRKLLKELFQIEWEPGS